MSSLSISVGDKILKKEEDLEKEVESEAEKEGEREVVAWFCEAEPEPEEVENKEVPSFLSK